MKFLILFSVLVSASAEQGRDADGKTVWKSGSYRNRDVVPRPTSFDAKKKHKRDVEDADSDDENDDVDDEYNDNDDTRMKASKKSFIRTHFSLPLGAEIPLGFSGKVQRKSAKKDEVARVPLENKLAGDPYDLVDLEQNSRGSSKSSVPKIWGYTWKEPHQNQEHPSTAYERSNLEEVNKNTGKISEEEFDSGLMGRGLGGLKERAQNENLMEKKFQEKIEDEQDAEDESMNRRSRRAIFFPPHLHHYHHHHHGNRQQRPNKQQAGSRHPAHSQSQFPNATANSSDQNRANSEANETVTTDSKQQNQSELIVNSSQTTEIFNKTQSSSLNQTLPIISNFQGNTSSTTGEGSLQRQVGTDGKKQNSKLDLEYEPQLGDAQDGEFDKTYPVGIDGSPEQYNNHNPHHNVFNLHQHSPYEMHQPHGDYKNKHPGHPDEDKMNKTVSGKFNFTNPLLDSQFGSKRTDLTGSHSKHGTINFGSLLRHIFWIGGKIPGRHRDEDLSPAEIIT